MSRQLQVIVNPDSSSLLNMEKGLWIGKQPPSFPVLYQSLEKIQNLLGQEFIHIIFDARDGFHLEAFAIAAGTLKEDGTLFVLLKNWQNLTQQIDQDSLRWCGEKQPICTPHFAQHFKQLIETWHFPVLNQPVISISPTIFPQQIKSCSEVTEATKSATTEQQMVIEQILKQESELYFITAKRGRGKSALLGLLANQIAQPIYLTAPNKAAVHTLLAFTQVEVRFIAPDELVEKLNTQEIEPLTDWLFVDEAAMLPLPTLETLSHHFKHIVFSTTTHSYEGTGKGFELKFLTKIHRTFRLFELQKPLRWQENDRLEGFVEALLLLNTQSISPPKQTDSTPTIITGYTQQQLLQRLPEVYHLLSLAHYRTSPIDLRRLLDAPKQQFLLAEQQGNLQAVLWLLQEGGISNTDLIAKVCRGERRPQGNLVPQAIAFHLLLPQMCRLSSLRISRIAVQPHQQRQGIGTELIQGLFNHAEVDLLSVSFGFQPELAEFWQKCGFILVHLGEHKEASSGCYSAIALAGLSPQGIHFCQQAKEAFERHISLSFHPLASRFATSEIHWQMTENDWQSLQYFAYFHRTLADALPAIRRLFHCWQQAATSEIIESVESCCPLLHLFLQNKTYPAQNKKQWLQQIRQEVSMALLKFQFHSTFTE